jgi:hypothetical protein
MSDWPTEPTDIIREALREYVGDGDGADLDVLAAHDRAVAAKALRDAADALPWTTDPPEWLRVRADRIEAGDG